MQPINNEKSTHEMQSGVKNLAVAVLQQTLDDIAGKELTGNPNKDRAIELAQQGAARDVLHENTDTYALRFWCDTADINFECFMKKCKKLNEQFLSNLREIREIHATKY